MKRLLLDENLPKQLKGYFSPNFEVVSISDLGWQSKTNGELLIALDKADLKYLLTADRNIKFQQNLEKYAVIIVVLVLLDNRLKSLVPFVKEIEQTILDADPTQKLIEIDLRSS
ncbi:MAG: hypothetical protein ABIV48_06610 [Pyrinomonadaceae bacterium]